MGKPTGNDLREGKVTLPLLHVLLESKHPDNEKMLALCSADRLDENEIEVLIAYAKENGGIEYAREKMHELQQKAESILDTFEESDAREQMRKLLSYVVTRNY